MIPSYGSPKRKRDRPPESQLLSEAPNSSQSRKLVVQIPTTPPASSPPRHEKDMRFPTNIPGVQMLVDEEDAGSPRTKVAYHFQGLQLQDGGDVSKLSLDMQRTSPPKLAPKSAPGGDHESEEDVVRKRVRVLEGDNRNMTILAGRGLEIPETPMSNGKQFTISIGPERTVDPIIGEKAKKVVLYNEIDPVVFTANTSPRQKKTGLARAYPSINRLADSKSRAKAKRAVTPPLFGAADATIATGKEVVDEERATLTWHDNEITGHNTNDPDDDGEGINGIGFRPTAAEAHARAQKRRQQMADYKSREAKEARARRSEKRRGIELASKEEKEVERRVRFMEAEKASIVSII